MSFLLRDKMPIEKSASVKYLLNCYNLENEAFSLYSYITKRLLRPEIKCMLLTLSQDCTKHTKIIEELLKPLLLSNFEETKYEKNFNEISTEIRDFNANILKIPVIDDEMTPQLLNNLIKIEDCLFEFYSNFVDSKLLRLFADQISTFIETVPENLSYIIESLREDNQKHRNMLIETLYIFNKDKSKNKDTTPLVRFKNPDAWIQA